MIATRTIVDNASAAPNLSTLVTAIKAAELTATLSGTGPFTVFAPSNAAFGRLAPGMVDTLLKPENKASLAKVLTYHVVAGDITAADLKAPRRPPTPPCPRPIVRSRLPTRPSAAFQ